MCMTHEATHEFRGKTMTMKIEIDVNAAVRIWDLLNEVALNQPKGAFRRSVIRYRNVVEKAMTDKGLSVPESGNGRA